ncbi:isoflavone reductase family protein [Penicillium verhagenii]|nr:isoflavone reductase family protein [Penicillium verhagenii]
MTASVHARGIHFVGTITTRLQKTHTSTTRSFDEIAGIMQTAGAGSIVVSEVELKKYKEETTSELSWDPSIYLRFLMGEGKINHTARGLGNSNELVNPNQKLWKWVTLSDLAKENKGRPWKDFPWPPQ